MIAYGQILHPDAFAADRPNGIGRGIANRETVQSQIAAIDKQHGGWTRSHRPVDLTPKQSVSRRGSPIVITPETSAAFEYASLQTRFSIPKPEETMIQLSRCIISAGRKPVITLEPSAPLLPPDEGSDCFSNGPEHLRTGRQHRVKNTRCINRRLKRCVIRRPQYLSIPSLFLSRYKTPQDK